MSRFQEDGDSGTKQSGVSNFNLAPFKLDIDELIAEYVQGGCTNLADMKRIWLSRKFSYIFDARPPSRLAWFMQSLYAHTLGYMFGTGVLSERLGGFYCLYCLYEVQPFKPPFKIYISLGELKKLTKLMVNAKQCNITVAGAVVQRMLDKNMFLIGSIDLNEGLVNKTVDQLTELQNKRIEVAHEKLIAGTQIQQFLHMDMGKEFDLNTIKKTSTEYAEAKKLAIGEASKVVDVQNIKHIAEDRELVGDRLEKIAKEWNIQRDSFCEQTGLNQHPAQEEQLLLENQQQVQEHCQRNEMEEDSDDEFTHELERQLAEVELQQQKHRHQQQEEHLQTGELEGDDGDDFSHQLGGQLAEGELEKSEASSTSTTRALSDG